MTQGYSLNENFMAYLRYGNHHSCDKHSDKFKKVMAKDSKRGNIILVDEFLLWFIPYLHLTPQAMVDVLNKWKNECLIFDSTFCPFLWYEAFNDWVDNKITKGECHFLGSF